MHAVAPEDGRDDGAKGLAVLFCDLDGFKSINDRFGHNAGDAVLIEVARRLSGGVRDGDTVARLGGDEFVILANGLGRADAQDLAVRLRGEIIQPIRAEGRAVRVGASFGIGWAHCGMTADEVLKSATNGCTSRNDLVPNSTAAPDDHQVSVLMRSESPVWVSGSG